MRTETNQFKPAAARGHQPGSVLITQHQRRGSFSKIIAAAYRAGVPTAETCHALKISRQTYYTHLKAAGITPQRETARRQQAGDELIGPDRPYVIQICCGVPCNFSIQLEGAWTTPQPEPEEQPI